MLSLILALFLTVSSYAATTTAANSMFGGGVPNIVGTTAGLILPAADGTTGQILKTDGALQLGWVTPLTPSIALPYNNGWNHGISEASLGAAAFSIVVTGHTVCIDVQAYSHTFAGADSFIITGHILGGALGGIPEATTTFIYPLTVNSTLTLSTGFVIGDQIKLYKGLGLDFTAGDTIAVPRFNFCYATP